MVVAWFERGVKEALGEFFFVFAIRCICIFFGCITTIKTFRVMQRRDFLECQNMLASVGRVKNAKD